MKILLVHGYFLSRDKSEQKVMKPYPPLGLLYLSASLKKAGYDVQVFDGTFSDFSDFEKHLKPFQPDVIGFYANMMTRHNILELNAIATSKGFPTIVGGPDPPHYAEAYLEKGFKAVVVGEGEGGLLSLLGVWSSPEKWQTIPGLIYLSANQVIRTPLPKPNTPLDNFPFPDREAIDINQYLDCWERYHQQRPMSLITSRGCPFQCTWCSHNVYGYSLRKRTPENVLEEFDWLHSHYRFDSYWFADDVFTIQPKWNTQFAEKLLQHPSLVKPFECISRADKLHSDTIQTLRETKCARVWVGAESGSQRLLDQMKRGVTRNQVIAAVHELREAGIETGMFFMWGFMDESLQDIMDTISLAEACIPHIALTTVAYPIRGTKFFSELEKQDLLDTDVPFEKGTDRDISIRGQADPGVYDLANQYLHCSLNAARAKAGPFLQQCKGLLYLVRKRNLRHKLVSAFQKQGSSHHISQIQRRPAS